MPDQILQETIRIKSPCGQLAGELAYPDSDLNAAVLIINPHPLMGGRMDNRLVAQLAENLPQSGIATLRFDYSGVGNSDGPPVDVASAMSQFWETGTTPADPRMIQDAAAALDWLHANINQPTVVIGYSFGAYAAVQIVKHTTNALVLITPTLTRHDYTKFQNTNLPTFIVHSDNDFATDTAQLQTWVKALQGPTTLQSFHGADHFFRGQEKDLADACTSFILKNLPAKIEELAL